MNSIQGGFLIGDRYEARRATMLELIHLAYNVDADKIYGGPSWLDYDKFDIEKNTGPLPAYVLSGKDQTKLKAAEGAGGQECQSMPIRPNPPNPPGAEMRCQGVTMDEFVSGLARRRENALVGGRDRME